MRALPPPSLQGPLRRWVAGWFSPSSSSLQTSTPTLLFLSPSPAACPCALDSRACAHRRRIRAKQAEFQRLKKLSGNTHTAKYYMQNRAIASVIIVGGLVLSFSALKHLAYGTNKYVVKGDDE